LGVSAVDSYQHSHLVAEESTDLFLRYIAIQNYVSYVHVEGAVISKYIQLALPYNWI
jgi:hypothetical protein